MSADTLGDPPWLTHSADHPPTPVGVSADIWTVPMMYMYTNFDRLSIFVFERKSYWDGIYFGKPKIKGRPSMSGHARYRVRGWCPIIVFATDKSLYCFTYMQIPTRKHFQGIFCMGGSRWLLIGGTVLYLIIKYTKSGVNASVRVFNGYSLHTVHCRWVFAESSSIYFFSLHS